MFDRHIGLGDRSLFMAGGGTEEKKGWVNKILSK
jgi:hypothetical protein